MTWMESDVECAVFPLIYTNSFLSNKIFHRNYVFYIAFFSLLCCPGCDSDSVISPRSLREDFVHRIADGNPILYHIQVRGVDEDVPIVTVHIMLGKPRPVRPSILSPSYSHAVHTTLYHHSGMVSVHSNTLPDNCTEYYIQ